MCIPGAQGLAHINGAEVIVNPSDITFFSQCFTAVEESQQDILLPRVNRLTLRVPLMQVVDATITHYDQDGDGQLGLDEFRDMIAGSGGVATAVN
jgi:hypothetical protein